MRERFLFRLRRCLAAETGAALVTTIGISLGMMVAGTSVIEFTTVNQHGASRSAAESGAAGLAEAGLNSAYAVLSNPASSAADSTLLPVRTTQYQTGSATWSGTYDRATAMWTLTSTGRVRNPSAVAADVARTVVARVRVRPVHTQPVQTDVWQYLYSRQVSAGGSCDVTLGNTVWIGSPMYVNGNVCMYTGSRVAGAPLVVKGRANILAADAGIGTSAAPIAEAHIGLGCSYLNGPLNVLCPTNVWVQPGRLDQVIPAVAPPPVSWDAWYWNAAPGPREPCTAATGTPPVFEDEIVAPSRNGSVFGSFNLTPPSSYSCRVGPADDPIGQLAWDAGTRRLTVKGTIFIDGSAKVENGQVNVYQGQGTLYLSGTFLVSGASKLCAQVAAGGTECDFTGWDPRATGSSLLTVVTNGSGGQTSIGVGTQLSAAASFEGLLYASSLILLSTDAQAKGGMVGWTVGFGRAAKTYPFPALAAAPTGTPGAQQTFAQAQPPEFAN